MSIPKARILLIEDEIADIELIKTILAPADFVAKIDFVKDGEESLKYLFRFPPYHENPSPQLILLDLNLPKISGLEILDRIKKHPELMKIPVVILSSSNSEDDIRRSYKKGADLYIKKPLQLEQYQESLQTLRDFWLKQTNLQGEGL